MRYSFWLENVGARRDYSVALALVGPDGRVLSKTQRLVGQGMIALTRFPRGAYLREEGELISEPTELMGADLRLSLFDFFSGETLPLEDPQGRPLGTSVAVTRVVVYPRDYQPRSPTHVAGASFGDRVRLEGYSLEGCVGDRLRLYLVWTATREMERRLSVFVHALATDGKLVGQADGVPQAGWLPTDAWPVSVEIPDEREVQLESEARYLRIGLYNEGGQRLLLPDGRDALEIPCRP